MYFFPFWYIVHTKEIWQPWAAVEPSFLAGFRSHTIDVFNVFFSPDNALEGSACKNSENPVLPKQNKESVSNQAKFLGSAKTSAGPTENDSTFLCALNCVGIKPRQAYI